MTITNSDDEGNEEQMEESGEEGDAPEEGNAAEDGEEEEEQEEAGASSRAYLPNRDPGPGPDEELVMDSSAYRLYYQLSVESPCLSLDLLADPGNAGAGFDFDNADRPLTCFLVAGTQAKDVERNAVCVMRASGLFPMRSRGRGNDNDKKEKEEEDDDEEEEEEEEDDEESERRGEVSVAQLRHNRTVNRVRAAEVAGRPVAATWSEAGAVYVFDLAESLAAVSDHRLLTEFARRESSSTTTAPIFSFHGHGGEGFGLDWCRLAPGRLASGDCSGRVHVWHPAEAAGWRVDQRPLVGHSQSVEDLQWSPTEASVLASCSVDRSLRIFDIRARPDKACMLARPDSHEGDVNVVAWNRVESQYLLSGGDDAVLNVFDLRSFADGSPPASQLRYHRGPITSVQWHPDDSSVFLATSEDNQLTLWDLACEKEADNEASDLPPQLLFIHMGQEEMKEGHWHPQLPGLIVSTAQDGMNIFKTISI